MKQSYPMYVSPLVIHKRCLYIYLQFGLSCYSSRYLEVGSWSDAEHECNDSGSHLWSINSHEEFYHILRKTLKSVKSLLLWNEFIDISGNKFDPRLSPHFFIGLVHLNPGKSSTLKVRQDRQFQFHVMVVFGPPISIKIN